jgi:protoheme IX farnesyltransferase
MSGVIYGAVAAISGLSLLLLALRLLRTAEPVAMKRVARSLFVYSSSYLFVIFLALMTDHVARAMGWV